MDDWIQVALEKSLLLVFEVSFQTKSNLKSLNGYNKRCINIFNETANVHIRVRSRS